MLDKGDTIMLVQPDDGDEQIEQKKILESKQKLMKTDEFQRRVNAEVKYQVKVKTEQIEEKYQKKFMVIQR